MDMTAAVVVWESEGSWQSLACILVLLAALVPQQAATSAMPSPGIGSVMAYDARICAAAF
jgi:hypothetical protein